MRLPWLWRNPDVGFDRPCVRGTGIRTAVIFDRWQAGESIPSIASDYMTTVDKVIAAVGYEVGRRERYRREDYRSGLEYREAMRP